MCESSLQRAMGVPENTFAALEKLERGLFHLERGARMTRLEYIASAYLAGDMDTVESALAFMPRPSTLASPVTAGEESDVARGKLVLFFVDPVAGIHIRAVIRATFTGAPLVRVTGRNRHGARDWLAERLPGILDAKCWPYEGAGLPLNLPPELQ